MRGIWLFLGIDTQLLRLMEFARKACPNEHSVDHHNAGTISKLHLGYPRQRKMVDADAPVRHIFCYSNDVGLSYVII
jgi:hypothetical protein